MNRPLALLSVSDKSGIADFARRLIELNFKILSTGGTASHLEAAGIPVVAVSDHTGFPEIMGGRVKTLHPRIHGGILGRLPEDEQVMADQGIGAIDVVAVNLYPFAQTVARGCSRAEAIEQIDIGGPAMVRAAAKNHSRVFVVTDPSDYGAVIEGLNKTESGELRADLAARAFAHTARYDAMVARYLGAGDGDDTQATESEELRYGENPHQPATLIRDGSGDGIAHAELVQGKALSYNNLADADAAWQCVAEFDRPACVIVKHANPCGVGRADDLAVAYQRAWDADPLSAFGGIIAVNRPLPAALARQMIDKRFVEVIVAPEIDEEARKILAARSNLRVLVAPIDKAVPGEMFKSVGGGQLRQATDRVALVPSDVQVVSRRAPTPSELTDMLFADQVVKHVKSNAIVLACDDRTTGIGAGQMSRVKSVEIAVDKMRENDLTTAHLVLASDAFFPFADGIEVAGAAGVTAIIQPGGSKRDPEVIAAADNLGIAMVFSGVRRFRH